MTEKHLKETLTYLAIREMEIKTTLRFCLIAVRIAKNNTKVIQVNKREAMPSKHHDTK